MLAVVLGARNWSGVLAHGEILMKRSDGMFLAAASDRGVTLNVLVHGLDAVDDVIRPPDGVFRPPSIWPLAVNG